MCRTRSLLLLVICVLMPVTALAQWEQDVRLTDNSSDSVTCFNNGRCVATAGATIHVVWHDSRDGNTEIYYKSSADDGMTWGADKRLTTDGSWSERAAVAVNGPVIHVVWYDGRLGPPRIFYKCSLDNGTTWGTDVCLTPTAGVGYHPAVAVSGTTVHVAWTDMSAGPQIYYTRSLDDGTTWEPARNITPTAPPAGKNLASIAVVEAMVHVTWMDTRGGPQIYYTRSLDGGANWETDRSISPLSAQFASVAAAGASVHVVYADFRYGSDAPKIYYTRSLDHGLNWETEVPLAEALSSWYPSVAVAGSLVHAVWLDNRHGDVAEIYYRNSLDDGTTWAPEVRLTDNLSTAREPSVAVSETHVHVAWHDDRDQNWEMYYKRGAGNVTGIVEDEDPVTAPRLLSAGPNPSPGQVVIRYALPSSGSVVLEIYAASGALIRRLTQVSLPAGAHEIAWNGRDGAGRAVPSGVYLTRIETGGQVLTGRVVLAR